MPPATPRWRCSKNEAMAEFPIAVPSGSSLLGGTVCDETRPANARTGHPRRLLRQDRDRESAAEGAAGGLAGIRAALRDRSRHKQACRPLLTRGLENVQASEMLRSLISAEARSKPFLAPTCGPPQRRRLQGCSDPAAAARSAGGLESGPVGSQGSHRIPAGFGGGQGGVVLQDVITGKGIRIKPRMLLLYRAATSMPAVPGFIR